MEDLERDRMAIFVCLTCSKRDDSLRVIQTTELSGVLDDHLGHLLHLHDETKPPNMKDLLDALRSDRLPWNL